MKTIRIFLTGVAFILVAVMVSHAQNVNGKNQKENTQSPTTAGARGNFTDNNSNGVCDHFEARGKSGKGAGFTDKDGDGICDNRQGSNQKGKGPACNGKGMKHRNGNGNGKGVCDGSGKRLHQGWK